MKIAIGSDHRGFPAKEIVGSIVKEQGHEIVDCGPDDASPCDYPDAAIRVAEEVARGEADRGILMCGSGIGVSMTANKVRGIRAALCHDELTAEMSRRHNDANVLCMPADLLSPALVKRMTEVWLSTEFEGGRHQRRVDKIRAYEQDGNR